jgi:ribosomal protein S18 acetylase RimI-like enzyme
MSAALIRLQPGQLAAVTDLLTDIFADDHGMRAICAARSPEGTRRALVAWFRATLRVALAVGQPGWIVAEGDRVAGVALGSAPAASWPLHTAAAWLTAVGAQCGWSTIWRTITYDQARNAYRPNHPHVVLEFLAVQADRRGRGYGSLLVKAVHHWSDAQPGCDGVWLETTRPERVPWFVQHGYHLTGRQPLAAGGEAYCLYRKRR